MHAPSHEGRKCGLGCFGGKRKVYEVCEKHGKPVVVMEPVKGGSLDLIPCTACRYCIEESSCPKGIRIPDLFAAKNAHEAFHNWNTGYYYNNIITGGEHGKASDCIKCGKCEKVCPQHLPIRQLLRDVARTFET